MSKIRITLKLKSRLGIDTSISTSIYVPIPELRIRDTGDPLIFLLETATDKRFKGVAGIWT
jgi:hypothetical protein